MITKTYLDTEINPVTFKEEIAVSTITIAIETAIWDNGDTIITFKADISTDEEVTLDTLVAAHNPIEVVDVIPPAAVTIMEQPPFAKPDYRTKLDGNAAWKDCPAGAETSVDFTLMEERYVAGGEIIFKNAKQGDYITASVYDGFDPDGTGPAGAGVIPEAYRTALCEAWPVVATYIVKKWLVPTETDKYSCVHISTYPLNAKISQYLQLRVTYHASAVPGTRSVATNYNLTEKL